MPLGMLHSWSEAPLFALQGEIHRSLVTSDLKATIKWAFPFKKLEDFAHELVPPVRILFAPEN